MLSMASVGAPFMISGASADTAPPPLVVTPSAATTDAGCIIQSDFKSGEHGNFEVVAGKGETRFSRQQKCRQTVTARANHQRVRDKWGCNHRERFQKWRRSEFRSGRSRGRQSRPLLSQRWTRLRSMATRSDDLLGSGIRRSADRE